MFKLTDFSYLVPRWNEERTTERILWVAIIFYSLFQSILLILIFVNHLLGPDIQRGAMFEAVSRLTSGLPLYPAPSTEYVGMVHNPLYPVLGAVFSLIFGQGMASLRFFSILGALGAWLLIFFIVHEETQSSWAGLVAVGLFASAYLSFDGYIDYANADSWLLFCSLFGLYVLNRSKTPKGWFSGIFILSLSFWFKQHGAIIAIAGLVYLTFLIRQRSALYWLLAFLLVPVAYLFLGPLLFGDKFLYYTYLVPRAWSVFDYSTIDRMGKYFIKHWAILGLGSFVGIWNAVKKRAKWNIWEITLPFALLVGLLGSLDPGSENNQYIMPGVWLIICGTIAFYRLYTKWAMNTLKNWQVAFAQILILLAFLQNYYFIPSAFFPRDAWKDYNNLTDYIENLDGDVYIPSIGQLPYDLRLSFTAPWVQLEDLVRGPGKKTENHPLIRSILNDIVEPDSKVYLITETPLEQDSLLGFLNDYYVLVEDFGDKYKSLRAVPGRFQRGWPRYVYAHK